LARGLLTSLGWSLPVSCLVMRLREPQQELRLQTRLPGPGFV